MNTTTKMMDEAEVAAFSDAIDQTHDLKSLALIAPMINRVPAELLEHFYGRLVGRSGIFYLEAPLPHDVDEVEVPFAALAELIRPISRVLHPQG